jgi:polar amino acid transport system substrate-binding protein
LPKEVEVTDSHQPSQSVQRELAPSGRLRAAINLGNPALARRDETGGLSGAAVELACRLAAEALLEAELIAYSSGGAVMAGRVPHHWDVAFVAADPERATDVRFTPPYLYIEGTCMVWTESPVTRFADLDRPGVRIAVADGAAYHLILTRLVKHAELRTAPTSPAAIDLFLRERLEGAAGVRQALNQALPRAPGARVLDDSFSRIGQAVAVPRDRSETVFDFVRRFIARRQADGFINEALARSGHADMAAAPAPGA